MNLHITKSKNGEFSVRMLLLRLKYNDVIM